MGLDCIDWINSLVNCLDIVKSKVIIRACLKIKPYYICMEKVSLIRFSLVPLKNNSRDSVILGKASALRYYESMTENQ